MTVAALELQRAGMDAPKQTVARARELRGKMSLPEVVMWRALRGGRLGGWRFRRQHPFGPYILDFYCAAISLAVEIDGQGHENPDAYRHDTRRDAWLQSRGVRVFRVPAKAVLTDFEAVLTGLLAHIRGE